MNSPKGPRVREDRTETDTRPMRTFSRPMRARIALLLAFSLWLSGATTVLAQQGAMQFLEHQHEAVRSILKRPAKTDSQVSSRNKALSAALGGLLDFGELSRQALRDHWDGLEQGQRDEFVKLLSQLVERNYQKNLTSTLDFAIRYEGEAKRGEAVVVKTVAQSRKNRRAPPVSIEYTLSPADGGSWRVYDVTTDGVSLVSNYRAQFNRIIKRDGWDALLTRMRDKLGSDDGLL